MKYEAPQRENVEDRLPLVLFALAGLEDRDLMTQQQQNAAPITDLPRWQAPEISDRAAFLQAHPECVVSGELLESLEGEIRRRTAQLDRSGDDELRADIRGEIIAGIFECATHYRSLDPVTGEPVFDYLAQTPAYIVRHAAGRVSSQLRRDRLRDAVTTSFDSTNDLEADSDERDILELQADPIARTDAHRVELIELAAAIERKLDPDTRMVWGLMVTGHDRTEIGALLGLPRQRVHDRCLRIRQAYAEVALGATPARTHARSNRSGRLTAKATKTAPSFETTAA